MSADDHAALAGVEETPTGRGRDCAVEVRVSHHDKRVVVAEFELHTGEVLRGKLRDRLARSRRSGE